MTRNFIPKNRGIVVLKRHLPMITIPAMIGIVIVLLWRFIIFPLDWNFTNLSDPVLFIALPLACLIYVLFATIAISSVFQQYKEVSKSVILLLELSTGSFVQDARNEINAAHENSMMVRVIFLFIFIFVSVNFIF